MIKQILIKIRQKFFSKKNRKPIQPMFSKGKDKSTNLETRKYKSYNEYVQHQASKLDYQIENIRKSDDEYEDIVFKRYKKIDSFSGKSVLCLGARLGGEVRAFKKLNALAIGIDLNPGPNNKDVLIGDVHNLQFPDSTFDFVFSNVIDHVLDLPIFLNEIIRVLKPKGVALFECANVEMKPGKYEVVDLSDLNKLKELFKKEFFVNEEIEIHNKSSYIDWKGKLYILSPKDVKVVN